MSFFGFVPYTFIPPLHTYPHHENCRFQSWSHYVQTAYLFKKRQFSPLSSFLFVRFQFTAFHNIEYDHSTFASSHMLFLRKHDLITVICAAFTSLDCSKCACRVHIVGAVFPGGGRSPVFWGSIQRKHLLGTKKNKTSPRLWSEGPSL